LNDWNGEQDRGQLHFLKQEHGEGARQPICRNTLWIIRWGPIAVSTALKSRRRIWKSPPLFSTNDCCRPCGYLIACNTAAPWLMGPGAMSEITYKLKGFVPTLTRVGRYKPTCRNFVWIGWFRLPVTVCN